MDIQKGIGSILKEAREALGLSLEQVEEKTNIRANYLRAIEQEDFSKLPGEVFAKGMIRSYGNFLGLKGNELVDLYKAQSSGRSLEEVHSAEGVIRENANVKMNISLKQKRDWGTGNGFSLSNLRLPVKQLAMGAAALVLLGAMYWTVPKIIGMVKGQPEQTPAATQVQKPAVQETKPVITDKVEVTVETLGKCWTEVNGDGKEIFAGMLVAGDKKVFTAKEKLVIKYGNIGVTRVAVNGEPVPLKGEQGVVTKTYAVGQPVQEPSSK